MRLFNDGIWVWGRLTHWAFKRHIATEIRPYSTEHGIDRETAFKAFVAKAQREFEAVWPAAEHLSKKEG